MRTAAYFAACVPLRLASSRLDGISRESVADAEVQRFRGQRVVSLPQVRLLKPGEAAVRAFVVAVKLDLPSRSIEEAVGDAGVVLQDRRALVAALDRE